MRISNVRVFPLPESLATMVWLMAAPVSKLIVYGLSHVIVEDQDVVLTNVIVQDFETFEWTVEVAVIVPVSEELVEEPV